jgi:HTH-type transcriptional regulator, sugar sensing transcriptional regulator
MHGNERSDLKRLGLSRAEAEIYLALARNGGTLGATALADATGVQRTAVYPILTSLTQKGMVEAGAGYGSRFTAVRPDEALPSLIAREREELLQRERLAEEELLQRKRLADELVKHLESVAKWTDNNGEAELIQVLRDPRVIGERFERLQLEAERQVDIMVRAPILNPRRDNPAQQKAQRRGVRFRCLYEPAAIEDAEIEPYLKAWIAGGEEARIHHGKLPHKVAIFDSKVVLLPLIMPGDQMRALFIRHQQLAEGLSMLFDFLWERAESIPAGRRKSARSSEGLHIKSDKQAAAVRGDKPVQAKPEKMKMGRDGIHRQA